MSLSKSFCTFSKLSSRKLTIISFRAADFLLQHCPGPIAPPKDRIVVVLDVSSGISFVEVGKHWAKDGKAHNSWITEDDRYLLTTTEQVTHDLRSYDLSGIWNPAIPLDAFRKGDPVTGIYSAVHNAFVRGEFCYISHYSAGLVVLDVSDPYNLIEIGHYDTYPPNDDTPSDFTDFGAWGTHPYFNSCNIAISDREQGLFVVKFPGSITFQQDKIITCNQGFAAKNTIYVGGNGYDFTIRNFGESALVAKDHIIIKGNFIAERGSYFHAHISDLCAPVPGKWSGSSADHNKPNNKEQNRVNLSIFPNPFYANVEFDYSNNVSSEVTLTIHDIYGREVAKVLNQEVLYAGEYHNSFDGINLPEGLYIYSLRSEDANGEVAIKTGKLIKMK